MFGFIYRKKYIFYIFHFYIFHNQCLLISFLYINVSVSAKAVIFF